MGFEMQLPQVAGDLWILGRNPRAPEAAPGVLGPAAVFEERSEVELPGHAGNAGVQVNLRM